MTDRDEKIDISDVLLMVSVVCLVGGVALYSWRAAIIFFGALCFLNFLVLNRAHSEKKESGR